MRQSSFGSRRDCSGLATTTSYFPQSRPPASRTCRSITFSESSRRKSEVSGASVVPRHRKPAYSCVFPFEFIWISSTICGSFFPTNCLSTVKREDRLKGRVVDDVIYPLCRPLFECGSAVSLTNSAYLIGVLGVQRRRPCTGCSGIRNV